jgi:hypothetical protein
MGAITKSAWKLRKSVAHPGAGNTITYEIDKGGFLEDLMIIARGSVNVTGGTTNGTATGDFNPQAMVNMFEVIAVSAGVYPDGTLKRVYPETVHTRYMFDTRDELPDYLGATIAGTGSTAVYTPYVLRFALPKNPEPNETSLWTGGYTGLQLIITCGHGTDMYNGNDRNWDFSGVTFDIYDRRNQGSPNSTEVAVLYEQDIIIPINGANTSWNLRDYLQQKYGYLDILALFQTTNHVLTDGILQQIVNIEDANQTPFFYTVNPPALKFRQFPEIGKTFAAAAGLYRIPLAEDFMLSNLIQSPAITLNVSNPGGANVDRIILSCRRVAMPAVDAKSGAVSFS